MVAIAGLRTGNLTSTEPTNTRCHTNARNLISDLGPGDSKQLAQEPRPFLAP